MLSCILLSYCNSSVSRSKSLIPFALRRDDALHCASIRCLSILSRPFMQLMDALCYASCFLVRPYRGLAGALHDSYVNCILILVGRGADVWVDILVHVVCSIEVFVEPWQHISERSEVPVDKNIWRGAIYRADESKMFHIWDAACPAHPSRKQLGLMCP